MLESLSLHLWVVVLTPAMLVALSVPVTWLWPSRIAMGLLLVPAWLLSVLSLGMVQVTDELAGPVVHYMRLDLAGLLTAVLLLPGTVIALWHKPWAYPRQASALTMAMLAGITPVPIWLVWYRLMGGRCAVWLGVLAGVSSVLWLLPARWPIDAALAVLLAVAWWCERQRAEPLKWGLLVGSVIALGRLLW